MTVAELVALLTEMPQELEVLVGGCDCINPVGTVEVDRLHEDDDRVVLIDGDTDGH